MILWHGRITFKRSAVLSQYVIHRGLIIAVIQALFSIIFNYVSVSIYAGLLLIGYTTVFNNLPLFSVMVDNDVSDKVALEYSPLYKTL